MNATSSPRLTARIAGFLYLIVFVAIFSSLTRDGVTVSDDAAATAQRIQESELIFRLAFAADLVSSACYLAVTAILYDLLKPVSRTLSLLGAFFGIAGSSIMAANMINHLATLYFLGDADYLAAFEAGELQALSYLSLRLHALGYNISLVFFGIQLFFWGRLILGATFLPRIIGVLLIVAGAVGVANSFGRFLDLEFVDALYPYNMLPSLIAEGALTLWLMLFGLNADKWRKQAVAAERGGAAGR